MHYLKWRSWDCRGRKNSRHYNGHWGFLPCINDTGYFRCLSTYQNKTTKRALIYSISINLIRLIFRQLQPFDRVARVPCDIQTEFPVYQLCAKVRRLVDMVGVLTKTDIVGQIGRCMGSGCTARVDSIMTRDVTYCRRRRAARRLVGDEGTRCATCSDPQRSTKAARYHLCAGSLAGPPVRIRGPG